MEEQRDERRKFPRLKVELLIRYKILKPPNQQSEGETEARDIGGGGVCLVAREQLEPATVLALEIKFPQSAAPVVAVGRVAWSKKSSLGPSPAGHTRFDNGIEFIEIRDADRQNIIEHVDAELKVKKTKDWKVGIVKNIPNK